MIDLVSAGTLTASLLMRIKMLAMMLLIVFLYSIVALSLLLTATTNALSSTATPKIINTNDIYTIPNLQSKVAIVTGASRGIGRGIAIELGRAGMTVYVVGRSSTTTGYISQERELCTRR